MKLFPHNFGEPHNRTANPPGYLLSDIKRRSLSLLLDRIPRKKSPATRAERQSSVAVGYAIGNGGWCQRSMISVVTFV